MTNIDQFESVFKSADKPVFHYQPPDVSSFLLVTDQDRETTSRICDRAERFLKPLVGDRQPKRYSIAESDYDSISQLLGLIETAQPSLVCTYRNLHIRATDYPYSLGAYVDVITQVADAPVMLFPRNILDFDNDPSPATTNTVMAITDHLTCDDRLVNYAAQLTATGGRLFLTHVEDVVTFERYIATIGKIPSIDTEGAREDILAQLLKEPKDYVRSCAEILHKDAAGIQVESVVTTGHFLTDYRRLIGDHDVDVLVMNTKDDDQLAMHGLAYPLTIELRDTPMLLL